MSSARNTVTSLDLESLIQREDHKFVDQANSSFSDLETPKTLQKFFDVSEKKIDQRSLLDLETTPNFSNISTNDGSHCCFTETHESIQWLDCHLECAQHNDGLDSQTNLTSCPVPSSEKAKTMILKETSKIPIKRNAKSFDADFLGKSMPYQEVVPIFGSYGPYTSSFSFLTEKRTALLHTDKFSTAFAKDPLPSSGKHKFSVYIEECRKMNPILYIGVVSGELRNENMGYRHGWTFISSFSPQSYLSGQKVIKESLLPRRGQVVTVLVDQEMGWVSFEVNGTKIIEGKMSLPKAKKTDVYPFICLGEKEGRVCFI